MSIQNALAGEGARAILCEGAVFELGKVVSFTADDQAIFTRGFPTGDTRALLRVVGDNAAAVEAGNNSRVRLRNVIIDGNRPSLGTAAPALIEFGSTGSGNMVEWVKAFEPRGWSVLYLGEGDDRRCSNAIARHNDLGPAGKAHYIIADGISLGCQNSIVEYNTITDATDGGIVVFQAPGSLIAVGWRLQWDPGHRQHHRRRGGADPSRDQYGPLRGLHPRRGDRAAEPGCCSGRQCSDGKSYGLGVCRQWR
jgi:hypothetical protein